MPTLNFQRATRVLRSIVFITSLNAAFPFVTAIAADKPLPNIVVMMADDMGMGDTSAYQDITGNSDSEQIHTPAMERLARAGIRFTDAHTPSTRCTSTRYGLLTGRYPWRTRLKYWVLFGAQGDPLIESDRPTIASMLRGAGYRTGLVGKWHVGLRYRRNDGTPAAEFADADLTKPLWDSPLDHGFDFCRFTSRSHGTSGAQPGKKNTPGQMVGPGHIDGRRVLSATGRGRKLASDSEDAYVLTTLGSRHFNNAVEFLNDHASGGQASGKPFFLYYACNSNHSPYTPSTRVGSRDVAGKGRAVDGKPTGKRGDFVYENDAALAGLLDWLEQTDDPRWQGHKLVENTLVVFTSDNGAEIGAKQATGPFRSNKGSCYEGGHRVPLIVSWPAGSIRVSSTSAHLVALTDLYATFAEIVGVELPDNTKGEKGAEDSVSFLGALRGNQPSSAPRLLFVNDHKEAEDPAVLAVRISGGSQWKGIFDAQLLRRGVANLTELYALDADPLESENRIDDPKSQSSASNLSDVALLVRSSGGRRLAQAASDRRVCFRLSRERFGMPGAEIVRAADAALSASSIQAIATDCGIEMSLASLPQQDLHINERGLGVAGGKVRQVEAGESLVIKFSEDVIVESAVVVAGQGQCGGYYRVGDKAPLAIYCIDADNDSKDQAGILSDIGVLRAGETLTLSGSPHLGSEAEGRWRLAAINVRLLAK